MADLYFPTLTSGIVKWSSFKQGYLNDPTIRSSTQRGTSLDRPGTEELVRTWQYTIELLTAVDMATLDAFQRTSSFVGGVPFWWYDPSTDYYESWFVRLANLIVLEPALDMPNYYDAHLYLKEEIL